MHACRTPHSEFRIQNAYRKTTLGMHLPATHSAFLPCATRIQCKQLKNRVTVSLFLDRILSEKLRVAYVLASQSTFSLARWRKKGNAKMNIGAQCHTMWFYPLLAGAATPKHFVCSSMIFMSTHTYIYIYTYILIHIHIELCIMYIYI